MAVDILSIPPMSAECERLFSSSGLTVTPLRSRLEATTIGPGAGVIHNSVMDVPDLDTKNHREEGSDPVKDDFNEESGCDTGAVSPPEDGDGDGEVVTLYY
ncbi:hypothetical protein LIPSTDRAFT_75718 [Lipomyces starkeyi NRRL Y-11557]|uniref:HAT C-terminal dimerisation domain-containing protein n=1 Tax=Lipomyces starkeyi NRRL Y-11557 TaxID=675824 RepID=A0A1E3PVN1_LIPST|nr:hypothetical protein LIPSTDRAFT_75718 [Lipomyces starkeyi NRRL Y-11557]